MMTEEEYKIYHLRMLEDYAIEPYIRLYAYLLRASSRCSNIFSLSEGLKKLVAKDLNYAISCFEQCLKDLKDMKYITKVEEGKYKLNKEIDIFKHYYLKR